MTRAPGTKKKMAARSQRLMEEGPLWPAAAIQRGPRTQAMLKSRTSQKPMVLRSWDLVSVAGAVIMELASSDHTTGGAEGFAVLRARGTRICQGRGVADWASRVPDRKGHVFHV